MKLSIVVPVYDERSTLEEIIQRVAAVDVGMDKEIIMVDDGSTDGTRDLYPTIQSSYPEGVVKVFLHEKNQGKGAALRTGFQQTTGDIVLVQDADLEYDPHDYHRLLKPILDGRADVVYGSRFVGSEEHRVLFFWHMIGNRMLTLMSNMLTNLNLTDMETCYKVFRAEVLKKITIKSNRFDFEPEITAKVAKAKCRIYEVGISYSGRDYAEGKKIGFKDAVQAVWTIFRYKFFD
ncbi:MAG: glycosyltransferase family 2 protein [Phycisphaerae bacterium]|nr:glycosyltransferase family 2 protein [Phycisphaerae bacterium]